jgi:hypothetical protein
MNRTWDGKLTIGRFCFSGVLVCILAGCNFPGDGRDASTPSVSASDLSTSQTTPPATVTSSAPPASTQATSSSQGSTSGVSTSTVLNPNSVDVGSSTTVAPSSTPSSGSAAPSSNSGSFTTVSANSTAQRPSYNTGNGFFVLNGKLYDANGNEFRIRGVNRNHWDNGSAPGIANSGANTVRWGIDFTRAPSDNINLLLTQSIQDHEVPIAGNWAATCDSDVPSLQAIVAIWVAQAAQWTTLNDALIVNVANEWGPSGSTVWRDTYISAIASLRGAGYTGPILIDSGGCGQDDSDLVQYSQAVFNSDPERNVIFSEHLYGNTNDYSASIQSVAKGNPTVITLNSNSATHPLVPSYNGTGNSWSGISAYQISGVLGMTQLNGTQPAPTNVGGTPGAWTITLSVDSTNWPDYTGGGTVLDYTGNYALKIGRLAQLSQTTGAVYLVGEFGPGKNIGPSPTMVTPAEIITAAEANGIGWLPWAWDSNNLANCQADNNSFSMTYNCGIYTQASDLTDYGVDVVLNPTYGLKTLATPASSL